MEHLDHLAEGEEESSYKTKLMTSEFEWLQHSYLEQKVLHPGPVVCIWDTLWTRNRVYSDLCVIRSLFSTFPSKSLCSCGVESHSSLDSPSLRWTDRKTKGEFKTKARLFATAYLCPLFSLPFGHSLMPYLIFDLCCTLSCQEQCLNLVLMSYNSLSAHQHERVG